MSGVRASWVKADPTRARMVAGPGERVRRLLVHLLLVAGGVLMAVPFVWMISTSLKEPSEVFTSPIRWIPETLRWSNYLEAWREAPFGRYFFNSAFVAIVTTLGQLVVSSMAAYAFARIPFFGREALFALFLGTMMVPEQLRLVPNFLVLARLGWIDTYYALTVPWMVSVFSIFFLRQFFMTIPTELEDAASIDGATRLQFLARVLVPLSRPAVLTVGLFTFIGSWNAFVWPLIVTNRTEMRTIQVGVATFFYEFSSVPTLAMAASTFAVLPVLVLFFFVQRQFIQGIARTGLKL